MRLGTPVEARSAWYGRQLRTRADEWIWQLSDDDNAEIDAALGAGGDEFLLPTLAPKLQRVRDEVERGLGFAVLRGLDVSGRREEEAIRIFWALGRHLGTPIPQGGDGHVIGHVTDWGLDIRNDHSVHGYQTNYHLPFHTDGADIAGLLCLRNARSGGQSRLVSAITAHNELARSNPDLLAELCQPFHFDARGQEAAGQKPYQVLPIFTEHEGLISVLYKRGYIDSAMRFPADEVPRLTRRQIRALDALDAVCAEPDVHLEMSFEPGDIQLVNNFVVMHARTSYIDWPEKQRRRHLLRLWLATPTGRPVPPAFIGSREFPFDRDSVRSI